MLTEISLAVWSRDRDQSQALSPQNKHDVWIQGLLHCKIEKQGAWALNGNIENLREEHKPKSLQICAPFTLCSDMLLFLYWSNTLKEQSGFFVFMANVIICFLFEDVEIVKIREAPVFSHKWEAGEAQGALDSQRGAVCGNFL